MGKTFVEDERPCDSCVNVTRYGCVSWNCEYINRDEAIKAWREKHEMADRKTEPTQNQHIQSVESVGEDRKTSNSSEKPNNCEHITEDGVTCAKYPACDDCLDNPLNKLKGSERLVKGSEQTEPTISKMEQVDKDINVRSKDEPQTDCSWK